MPVAKEKNPFLPASIAYNLLLLPVFIESIFTINKTIKATQPDIVINFYELLCGITYSLFRPAAPMVNIAHQYYFMTSNFKYTGKRKIQFWLLNFFSYFTTINSSKVLALSFRNEETEQYEDITIVPPLIRKEILSMQPVVGDYIHGYLLNEGYVDELIKWSDNYKSEKLHFFWDRKGASHSLSLSDTLTMHCLNDKRFIKYMNSSKAYATTAGFESVCEAMYLQKPILMVPTHIEQECNVIDALKSGAGITANGFHLDLLLNFIPDYKSDINFRFWVDAAENILLNELTNFELIEDNILVAI
jgi:uncharacterized protein (TIGR00661 family)